MPAPRKVLFIGDRAGVYREALRLPGLEVVTTLVQRDSYLDRALPTDAGGVTRFTPADKEKIFQIIAETEFDFLVSNGCTFVLPVSRLRRPHQLFLNVHPAYLPFGRGRSPINGAVLLDTGFIGATLHYMDDGVDTGPIIHQERIAVTDDLDLALLYHLAFALEAKVFAEGMRRLAAAEYQLAGLPHVGRGSYYSRRPQDQQVDLAKMSNAEILRRVRAFGIRSQGVTCTTTTRVLRVFETEEITNPHLLEAYRERVPGEIVLEYGERLLVRSRDGLLKFKSHVDHSNHQH